MNFSFFCIRLEKKRGMPTLITKYMFINLFFVDKKLIKTLHFKIYGQKRVLSNYTNLTVVPVNFIIPHR